jgi:chromate transport protein ChrA
LKSTKKTKTIFIWVIPILWGCNILILYFFPGDEHVCLFFGSMAVWWIKLIIGQFDGINQALYIALPIGCLMMALLGFLLDRLKAGKKAFFILTAITTLLLFILVLNLHSWSLERMHRKWSLPGAAACTFNLGLTFSTAVMVVLCGYERLKRLLKR